MISPTKEAFNYFAHKANYYGGLICRHASIGNPLINKYRFAIFTKDTPDGVDLLAVKNLLCHFDFVHLLNQYKEQKEFYFLYMYSFPRKDPIHSTFDPSSPRWDETTIWAPSFDEDTDPIVVVNGREFR